MLHEVRKTERGYEVTNIVTGIVKGVWLNLDIARRTAADLNAASRFKTSHRKCTMCGEYLIGCPCVRFDDA